LDILKVNRIDHGNRSLEDEKLVQRLVNEQIVLTVCPLSNLKLKVVDDLKNHPLRTMMNKGMNVTVNSDDPAYFGGYINQNFIKITNALGLSEQDIYELVKNSIESSFADKKRKLEMLKQLVEFTN